MTTIPVVWCKDPNSANTKPTAFALRGIQLQGDHITPQHIKALKELVNAASEGRFVLPANGAIMFLGCGLNINSEVQIANESPQWTAAAPLPQLTTNNRRSSEEIGVEAVVELSDDVVKDDQKVIKTSSDTEAVKTMTTGAACDSCVPYSEYELLYEFLCCAKCMNDRLAEEGGRTHKTQQKEPAPYIHFCDKTTVQNNRTSTGARVNREYPVEQKEPVKHEMSFRESDNAKHNAQVMDNNNNGNCNCSTAARVRRMLAADEQLPSAVVRHSKVSSNRAPTASAIQDRNDEYNNTATYSGGVNARSTLHNARLGTAGGRRSSPTSSMNNHHHQLRNKRIDRNCGRISIRRSKRRVECPRVKEKVLMTQRVEQNQQQQILRTRQRCDLEDHKIVVASKEISKREIERLLYARVNKLMKKKHRKELKCNKTFGDIEAKVESYECVGNSRELITPVIVIDPAPKSNASSRKTSFDSTCTVNSHDSGFIDILNRVDSNGTTTNAAVIAAGANAYPSNRDLQLSDNKPVDANEQLPLSIRKDSLDVVVGNSSSTIGISKVPGGNNNKMENLFIENAAGLSSPVEWKFSKGICDQVTGAVDLRGATKIECLTQSKNRRKSYEEFRSMFRHNESLSEPQISNNSFSNEIEEYDELSQHQPSTANIKKQPSGNVESSGKQYLLNPDQVQQIKQRRKSYEEFKLMMRVSKDDSHQESPKESQFTRSGSTRLLNKNSNRRRKSSLFGKFGSTKEEVEQPATTDKVIYDLLPKLEAATNCSAAAGKSSSIVKMHNIPERKVSGITGKHSLDTNSLSRLKQKLRESNSNLYEKLITYGTIYDIIQKKNLSYRKYDKYMTYGTIYEIMHRKSSITSNQNTYENFNYFQRKSSSENFNAKSNGAVNKDNSNGKNKRKVSSAISQQRKSLGEVLPYFATNFIAMDVNATSTAASNLASGADRAASGEGEYRMTSNSSCGTLYDMKRASEVHSEKQQGVQNTRFTVHRIEEFNLKSKVGDQTTVHESKKKLAPLPITEDEGIHKPVLRRRRFSNILKLEYEGGNQAPSEIPQILKAEGDSGDTEVREETGQASALAKQNCRHTVTAVGSTDEGHQQQHLQQANMAKALNDNYAKIKSKALFNEKSSIFKSNSLDMLSNVEGGPYPETSLLALKSSDNFFGDFPARQPNHTGAAGFAIKKNNSDSSLSTKCKHSSVGDATLKAAAGLADSGRGGIVVPSKSYPISDDLKIVSDIQAHLSSPSPPSTTASNLHMNIKKFFGRKNPSRRLSEFTRGEFLNEKA